MFTLTSALPRALHKSSSIVCLGLDGGGGGDGGCVGDGGGCDGDGHGDSGKGSFVVFGMVEILAEVVVMVGR